MATVLVSVYSPGPFLFAGLCLTFRLSFLLGGFRVPVAPFWFTRFSFPRPIPSEARRSATFSVLAHVSPTHHIMRTCVAQRLGEANPYATFVLNFI